MERGEHSSLLSAAIYWSALSLAWATLVGITSVIAGLASASVALVGFGANSILDGGASAVLVLRFRHEHLGRGDADPVERRAGFAVGAAMIGVSIYLAVSAIAALTSHSEPETSTIGIVVTAASVVIFPVLARAKLRLAGPLGSTALRGDGVLSLAGGILAAATLASLGLDAGFGWWWADAVAALLIAAILLAEGVRTIASSRRGD
jgi:divalent metal cation (Fe/Co/Zn/Cd) transporter